MSGKKWEEGMRKGREKGGCRGRGGKVDWSRIGEELREG